MLRTLMFAIRRARAILARRQLDEQLADEIRLHIELRRQSLIDAGMDAAAADVEARRRFGSVARVREETRDMRSIITLETVLQDVRYGLRLMRRAPTFTAVAVVSLGIGIGAAAAVFSLADAVLLRKLPVKAPDELVLFRWVSGPVWPFESLSGNGSDRNGELSSTSFSRIAFTTARAQLAGDADLFGFADLYRLNASVEGQPQSMFGQVVSGNYFRVLGVSAAAGRLLNEEDDRPAAAAVAVVGYRFAIERFGAVDHAVGKPLILNGLTFTVVGVAPKAFGGTLQIGQRNDVMVPMASYGALTRGENTDDPNFWWVLMMGRLAPGSTPDRVQATLDLVVKRTVAQAKPALAPKDLPGVVVQPGARGQLEERDTMREPLTAMALVVGIVLLVACANVANLLLARGSARLRELTIRVAIGASRQRVVRQLLTEGFVLALSGSLLGIALAQWVAAALLPALTESSAPLLLDTGLDARVTAFAILLGTLCCLLFGLLPAARATDFRVAPGLQESSRGAVGGRNRNLLAGGLVVVQVALSVLLVTTGGLLAVSLRNLQHVDLGFDPRNLVVFRADPLANGYDQARARQVYESAIDRLSALPGAASVSFSDHALITGSSSISIARPAGTPAPVAGSAEATRFAAEHRAWMLTIGDRFFETMRIPLVRGRTFSNIDSATSRKVAIVNEAMARRLFGTTDAIGRRLVTGLRPGNPEIEVVGICADANYTSIRGQKPPTVYFPYRQRAVSTAAFAIRTAGDPKDLMTAVRAAMQGLDSTLPIYDLRTQDEQLLTSLRREQLFVKLSALLGTVTLLLAAIGLYGLLAYSVARRTPELGVRMALGAAQSTLRWMVLRQSLVLVAIGVALGIAASLIGTRVVDSLLYGLSARSPAILSTAGSVMTLVALIAAYLPARRAAGIDPMTALRTE